MKKYPLGATYESNDSRSKWREHPEVEQARQLNHIANELAILNEGIESFNSLSKFVIKLLEEAMKK